MDLSTASGAQLLLGSGEVYVDRLVSSARTGEFFLGQCTQFALGVTNETLEEYNATTAARGLLQSVSIRNTAEVTIEWKQLETRLMAIALYGEDYSYTQGTASPTAEVITTSAKLNHWYQLGGDATPRRNVSAVVITGKTVDVDYKVDAVNGRIGIIGTGTIAAGSTVTVASYTYGTISATDAIRIANAAAIECFVRFVGKPTSGPTFHAELWKVAIRPEGEIGFIGDTFAAHSLKGKILDGGTNHATDPYGRIIRYAG